MAVSILSDPPVTGRIRSDSRRWFTEGHRERAAARRARSCVECHHPLTSGRTPYCSNRCLWKYHGRFFWDAARFYVMRRDRYTCRVCGTRARRRQLEVDHIREIARGGASLDYDNLQTLCKACHRRKTSEFLRGRGHRLDVGDTLDSPVWFPA